MNNTLSKVIDNFTPNFNKNTVEGPARAWLKEAPYYLDMVIKSIIATSNGNMSYLGWRYLSPHEEYEKYYVAKDVKTVYNLAKSDLYYIEIKFEYNGEVINRHLLLPYLARGGLMRISGTTYHIVPVLSDTVISPNHKEVFVRLLKDKLNFNRIVRTFMLNGERVNGQVIHSNTFRAQNRVNGDDLGTAFPAISLYLVGKYGLRETFRKYLNMDIIVTDEKDLTVYKDKYDIYTTYGMKPRGLKTEPYIPHKIKFLVPKTGSSIYKDNLIQGLIYTLDLFPHFADDLLTCFNKDVSLKDEIRLWRLMLGKIVYKNTHTVDRMTRDMDDHFFNLEGYIDIVTSSKLKETGVKIEDFFDLIGLIMDNFNTWLLNSKEFTSDLNNRYLDVLYYVLYEIIKGINSTVYDIDRKSQTGRILSVPEITRIFNQQLSSKKIFKLTKASALNISIMLADYTGDLMYPKVTAILEDQLVFI